MRYISIFVFVWLVGCHPSAETSIQLLHREVITTDNIHHLEKLQQFEKGILGKPIWSPDGQYIFTTSSSGTWRFDADDLNKPPIYFDQYFAPLTFNTVNSTVASFDANYNIIFWDLHTGEFIERFYDASQTFSWLTDIEFSPDGAYLAAGRGGGGYAGRRGHVIVWDVQTKEEVFQANGVLDDPVEVAFSHDGERLVAGGYQEIVLYETTTWVTLPIRNGTQVTNPQLSLDRNWLLYWESRNNIPVIINVLDSTDYCYPQFRDDLFYGQGSAVFSSTNSTLFLIASGNEIIFGDVVTCEEISSISAPVSYLEFSPDGQTVVGVGNGHLSLYDIATQEQIAMIDGFVGHIGTMTFSDDGYLFGYEIDENVHVWETTGFSFIADLNVDSQLNAYTHPFMKNQVTIQASYSEPDSQYIYPPNITLESNYSYECPAPHSTDEIRTFVDQNTPSDSLIRHHQLAFLSSDSRILITVENSSIDTVVWDTTTWQEIGRYDWQFREWLYLCDLELLVAQLPGQGLLTFWDSRMGNLLLSLDTPRKDVEAFQISPDATLIALHFSNGTIELWGVGEQ